MTEQKQKWVGKSGVWVKVLLLLMTLMSTVAATELVLDWFDVVGLYHSTFSEEFGILHLKNLNRTIGKHSLETDGEGFRRYPILSTPNNIMVLGDSITANVGVPADKTFTYLLQQNLSTTIIARGVEGWDTFHEYNYYAKKGHEYKPNTLILQVTVGNDLNNLHELTSLEPKKYPQPSLLWHLRLWLNQHSYTYRLIQTVYYNRIKNHANVEEGFFSEGYDETWWRNLEKWQTLISKLDEMTTAQNTTFIVFLHNDPRQENREEYNHWMLKRGNYQDFYTLKTATVLLERWLANNNIRYINDAGLVNETTDFLGFEDGHLSIQGNQKVSKLLSLYLDKLNR